jgi:hypothetical protein
VPVRKRDQLSLNCDHSHFIIIREQPIGSIALNNAESKSATNEISGKPLEKLTDSAGSATNKFRERLEEFLFMHQEIVQQQAAAAASATTTAPNGTKIFLNTNFSRISFR